VSDSFLTTIPFPIHSPDLPAVGKSDLRKRKRRGLVRPYCGGTGVALDGLPATNWYDLTTHKFCVLQCDHQLIEKISSHDSTYLCIVLPPSDLAYSGRLGTTTRKDGWSRRRFDQQRVISFSPLGSFLALWGSCHEELQTIEGEDQTTTYNNSGMAHSQSFSDAHDVHSVHQIPLPQQDT